MNRLDTRRAVRRHWSDHPAINALIVIVTFVVVCWYAVDVADRTESRLAQRHGARR